MKKSLSSQITEQSGDATKVAEGWEAARDAGLDRRSNTLEMSLVGLSRHKCE